MFFVSVDVTPYLQFRGVYRRLRIYCQSENILLEYFIRYDILLLVRSCKPRGSLWSVGEELVQNHGTRCSGGHPFNLDFNPKLVATLTPTRTKPQRRGFL
jgi:hypothetical protein